jgi:acyl-homoserine-lactone acylase
VFYTEVFRNSEVHELKLLYSLLLAAAWVAVPAAGAGDPLASHVTIYRDNYGTPHIVGDTEEATFFGYGYAQAEDHLEDMMIQYRDAQGRRAEIQGMQALGDGYLHFIPYEYRWDGDYLQRLLRTKAAVVENRDKIDPDTYKILDGFARGVNAYIAAHRSEIPAWIDSVAAEDIEALERSHYMRFYSIHDALQKMTGKIYDFPNFGSNQWAIVPQRSANGRIIHVEHTHMPWANRFQNYEAHLIVPGKLDAAGISWFGSPVFLDGFNDRITWSATWNTPNIADVYEEKINPENRLQYLYEGQWREIRAEYATFRIKGPKGMDTVTLPLYYTHHGPVVSFDKERHRAYAVKLPNFDEVNYATGLYRIMKARSLTEFKAAVGRQWMPRWNLLYSDAENIFWVHNGNVARRAAGYDWSKPVPGWTKETEWGPYLPFEVYPQLVNPASGFLQNCNNPPWVVTRNSGLKPLDPAPYYLQSTPKPDAGEEALNTRGERLFQVLTQDRKFTLADMKALAFDTYVMPAEVIVPLLENAWARAGGNHPKLARAMERIRNWDRRSGEQSVAYTYIYFWGRSYKELFSEDQFARFMSYRRKEKVDIHSPEEQDKALEALEKAVAHIEKTWGKPEVPWGEINVVVRGGTFPMDGSGLYDMLHPDEGVEQDNGRMYCNDGWGHLLIVMEGSPKQVWSLLPYGESQHPCSPHYNDQAKLHSRREVKQFWFTSTDILAHTESVWGDRDRLRRLP